MLMWHGAYLGGMEGYKDIMDNAATFKAAKNFQNYEVKTDETEFARQVGSFLQEMNDDATRFASLTRGVGDATDQVHVAQQALETQIEIGGYTEKQVNDLLWSDPRFKEQQNVKLGNANQSFITYERIANDYVDRVDKKAGEMLKMWDATIHAAKTQVALDAITGVLSLAGGLLYAGPAAVQVFRKPLQDGYDAFARAGGLTFGAGSVNTLIQKSLPEAKVDMDKIGNSAEGNLSKLIDRFNDWVETYEEAPPDPNPFVPI